MSYTVVAFHAHPDDESLLTGGTLARAVAEGHHVTLVVATDGGAGLTSPAAGCGHRLSALRSVELAGAARALGVAEVIELGYGDSGDDGNAVVQANTGVLPFARVPVDLAAARLAGILRARRAHVLLSYDEAGGYGHPDHRQVHAVAARAAELAATPLVLEATVERERLQRALRYVEWLPGLPAEFRAERFANRYLPRAQITHRVDVRPHLAAKRLAMAAHVSQTLSPTGQARTLAVLLRLPAPLYRRVCGYEWFREPGRAAGTAPVDDIFATLRG